jgi:hypothetical protein
MAYRVRLVLVTDMIGCPLEDVRQVATGGTRVCALLRNESVRCWGAGYVYGDVVRLGSIVQIAVRGDQLRVVHTDWRVFCWNGLPRDATMPALTLVAGFTNAVEVAVGVKHASVPR